MNFVFQRNHTRTLHWLLAVLWTDQVKMRKVRLMIYTHDHTILMSCQLHICFPEHSAAYKHGHQELQQPDSLSQAYQITDYTHLESITFTATSLNRRLVLTVIMKYTLCVLLSVENKPFVYCMIFWF